MIDFLRDAPILLAFLVVGIGAGIGAIRIRGISVGPAAALFVGLAVGAIDDSLSGAEGLAILRELGLVLFTYTVGLAAGPTFFAGLRRGGISTVAVTVALVAILAGIVSVVAAAFGFTAAERAGLFAGSATNTPSLQAAVEAVGRGGPGRRLLARVSGCRRIDAAGPDAAHRSSAPTPAGARAAAAATESGRPGQLDGHGHVVSSAAAR